jgi:excisionase family DNA binding protein
MDTNQVQQVLDHITLVVKSAFKDVHSQLTEQNSNELQGDQGDFISAEQAAQFLKIKLNTIYAKVEKGELPHYRSGKRKLLFSKKELGEYVATRKGKINKDINDAADNYIVRK